MALQVCMVRGQHLLDELMSTFCINVLVGSISLLW